MKQSSIFSKYTLALILLLAAGSRLSASPEKELPKGHLVIIGGGELTDGIMEKIISLGGGRKDARILIVPFARPITEDVGPRHKKKFENAGCEHVDLILAPREEIDRTENLSKLNAVTVVFFSGGDQKLLAAHLNGTKFLEKIHRIYESGGVVSGTSAGAAVMSKTMLAGGHAKVPKDKNANTYGVIEKEDVNLKPGFGFLPDNIVIHQHFIVRKRLPSLFSALLDRPDLKGVGIDESTAIVFDPQENRFEVIGESGVMVIDTEKNEDKKPPSFKVVLLSAGDIYQL
ncbi:MAG: cyanophycinase [Dysgonamonadaceae bacterium]|jgi:cyanophycinase|nr:cyanophycinase [Dysgonamonadaceae bacterium]